VESIFPDAIMLRSLPIAFGRPAPGSPITDVRYRFVSAPIKFRQRSKSPVQRGGGKHHAAPVRARQLEVDERTLAFRRGPTVKHSAAAQPQSSGSGTKGARFDTVVELGHQPKTGESAN